jgi:TolB protein
MMRKVLLAATALIAILVFASPFYSAVVIDIDKPGGRVVPIAVAPLKNLNSGDDRSGVSPGVADAIANDMKLSGWFRVIDRSAYIEGPQSGITPDSFDFKNWTTIGAETLVKGGFSVQGDELTVELRLFDVYQGKQLVGKKYTGRVRDFRRIAHRFSDEIINQFTGTPGPFNTRVAYVSNGGGGLKEVYYSHLDGTDKFQVTSNKSINLSPAWSPDGRMLLYTSYGQGRRSLYLYDLTSGRHTPIGEQSASRWPSSAAAIRMSTCSTAAGERYAS